MTRKCALYARCSLEEQSEFGLSSQLSELRVYAKKNGYSVQKDQEFVDDGYSGADLGRPALTKMRELIRGKQIDVVVVHAPDRLARRLALQLLLIEECEKASVKLEFLSAPSAESMEGRLLLQLLGSIAEFERAKIAERTLRGRREKARQGLLVGGRRPYGYQVTAGHCTVLDHEAKVIVEIFEWCVNERLSVRQIIARLNQRGYKPHSSARWAKSSVSRILRNEMYIGQSFYNRRQRVEPERAHVGFARNKKTVNKWRPKAEWISQAVPSIVSAELFQAAQIQLKRNSAHCSGRPSKEVYLLRGMLRCRCGRSYTGQVMFGDLYYRCGGRVDYRSCKASAIAAKRIEGFVWETVVRLLTNPALLEEKLGQMGAIEANCEEELQHLRAQIRVIEQKEARLLDAMLDSEIELPMMREKAKALEGQRRELHATAIQLDGQLNLRRDEGKLREAVLRYCEVLGAQTNTLDRVEQQGILRALLDEVALDGDQVRLKGVLPIPPAVQNRPQRADDRPARLR